MSVVLSMVYGLNSLGNMPSIPTKISTKSNVL